MLSLTALVSQILFLHCGTEEARRAYREEARAEWSQAFPLVLEKHGYLGFSSRDVSALTEPDLWAHFDCAIVAALPAKAWTDEVVEGLLASGIPALLEAPLPPALMKALGAARLGFMQMPLTLSAVSKHVTDGCRRFGFAPGGRIDTRSVRPVPRQHDLDWANLRHVPLTERQAEVWRAPGWHAERWSVTDESEVLGVWSEATGTRSPAIVRRGNVTACAGSLFAYLVRAHTCEPWARGEFCSSPRSAGIEGMLLALVDELHRRAGVVRVRVRPWPRGASWVLNVRHDFDRSLPSARVAALLREHTRTGSAATWYWRSRHLDRPRPWLRSFARSHASDAQAAARLVADDPRHEVALHTEQIWTGSDREQRVVEAAIGKRILGSSAHGDPTCFRFQGAPNVLWAAKRGLLYTELIQHAHLQPHRFPALGADGTIHPLSVICLPHHESFDLSMAEAAVAIDRILGAPARFVPAGGLLQVMNHPDIHTDELFATLAELPREGRLNWTAAKAADWWARTHVADELQFTPLAPGRLSIRSERGVDNLVLETLYPDGDIQITVLDLLPGEAQTFEPTAVVASRDTS